MSEDHAADLEQLATAFWRYHLETEPTEGHLLGDYTYAGFFEDATRAAEDRRIEALRTFASDAWAIEPGDLDDQQRLTRLVLEATATAEADRLQTRLLDIDVDPVFGPQVGIPVVLGMCGLPTPAVAEAMVEKLHGIGRYFGELADRLDEGRAAGRTPMRFAVDAALAQLDAALAAPLDADPVLTAVPSPPEGVAADWWERVAGAVADAVRPGMARYREAIARAAADPDGARPDDRAGLCWVPDGERAYAALLRYSTTTTLSAQQIHDIGLQQVDQLAEEYRALGPEVVGSSDLATIFEALRTDPALHFTRAEDLVSASEVALARAWEALPAWFETLPQAPCAVGSTTTGAKAYYFPPAADGSRGGTFFVNVDDPTSWGTFELESMAFHEGVPGHHLQLAIAGELDGVPEFRKHLHHQAYAEGWGLYTERLADEMGLYSGPVDRMGMLAADSMRACRLVVDTGMHALGWSRQQAVDYMLANTPLTLGMVQPEIDRYLGNPGQATSYMVGRLELLRMRAEAQARQGDAFDVRAFHTAVLDSGSMPLGVLDEVVQRRLPAPH